MNRPSALRIAFVTGCSVLLSCTTPTGGCACSPALTHAVAYGTVRTASGAPVVDATVRVFLFRDACGGETFEGGASGHVERTTAAGAYRARFHSVDGPRTVCLRVRAIRGGAVPDSVFVDGALVQMRHEKDTPAEVGVDLTFP